MKLNEILRSKENGVLRKKSCSSARHDRVLERIYQICTKLFQIHSLIKKERCARGMHETVFTIFISIAKDTEKNYLGNN